jgi:hypothetical protein
MELDLAVVLALDDHNVIELDLVALDGLAQIRRHLLGRREVVIRDRNKVTHT